MQAISAVQARTQFESTGRIEANGRHISANDGVLWGTNEYGVDTFMAHMTDDGAHFERASSWMSDPADPYYD